MHGISPKIMIVKA